jgi:hypothetical protein
MGLNGKLTNIEDEMAFDRLILYLGLGLRFKVKCTRSLGYICYNAEDFLRSVFYCPRSCCCLSCIKKRRMNISHVYRVYCLTKIISAISFLQIFLEITPN